MIVRSQAYANSGATSGYAAEMLHIWAGFAIGFWGPRKTREGRPSRVSFRLCYAGVNFQPFKLVNVSFNMLARLLPLLGKLRHEDLLDTVFADNRRK